MKPETTKQLPVSLLYQIQLIISIKFNTMSIQLHSCPCKPYHILTVHQPMFQKLFHTLQLRFLLYPIYIYIYIYIYCIIERYPHLEHCKLITLLQLPHSSCINAQCIYAVQVTVIYNVEDQATMIMMAIENK